LTTSLRNLTLGLILCLTLLPVQRVKAEASALVEAGQVIAGSGQIYAQLADEPERRLKRKAVVFKGDTIRVGANGFLQLRFSDGGLIALRPNSEFRIDDYHFAGQQDGSEKAVFKLVRGSLRAISGKIGKQNKDNYQLNTPVATIGIRGTDYQITLVCSGTCSMGGYVFKGGIYATGNGGKIVLDGDQAFIYPGDGTPPRRISKEEFDAMVATADKGDGGSGGGDDGSGGGDDGSGGGEDGSGGGTAPGSSDPAPGTPTSTKPVVEPEVDPPTTSVPTEQPAPVGSGLAGAYISDDGDEISGGAGTFIHDGTDREIHLTTVGNANNIATLARDAVDPECNAAECGAADGTATAADLGEHAASGTTWGTWVGGWESLEGNTPMGRLHWVFNAHPTSQTEIDNLKLENYKAVFEHIGGTTPSDQDGRLGTYFLPPRMIVNFGSNMITDYRVGVIFEGADTSSDNDDTYFYGGLPSPAALSGPEINFGLDSLIALPTGDVEDDHLIYFGEGNAGIIFVGGDASYALNSFGLNADVDGTNMSVVGAALLGTEHNSGNPYINPYGTLAPHWAVVGIAANWDVTGEEYNTDSDADIEPNSFETEIHLDANNNVTALLEYDEEGNRELEEYIRQGGAVLTESGSTTNMVFKGPPPPLVTWGRWSGAWEVKEDWNANTTPRGHWHFIYSDGATPIAARDGLSFVAEFGHIAGTTPTDESGNTGSYFFEPRLTVDFASQQIIAYAVGVTFSDIGGDRSFLGELAQPTGLAEDDFYEIDLDLNVTWQGPNCHDQSSCSGWGDAGITFLGSNASHAINTYVMNGNYWDEESYESVDVSAMGVSLLANEGVSEDLGRVAAVAAMWDEEAGERFVAGTSRDDGVLNRVSTATVDDNPYSVTNVRHVSLDETAGCNPYCELGQGSASAPVDVGTYENGSVQANWGRWGNNWAAVRNGSENGTPLGSMHYLTSNDATSQAQLANINEVGAQFNHIGGTAPTDKQGNVGTYTTAPNMRVNFNGNSGTTITAYNAGVYFEDTSRTFDLSLTQNTNVDATNTTRLQLGIAATGAGCGTGCVGTGTGGVTFLGDSASHAATSFGGLVRDNGGAGSVVDGVTGTSLMEKQELR
jgi:hypothetical protein